MFQSLTLLTFVIEQLPAVSSADVDHLDLLDTVCWSIDFLMIFFTVHCTAEESLSNVIRLENVFIPIFNQSNLYNVKKFVKKNDKQYSHAWGGAHLTSTNTQRRKLNYWILIASRLVANQWRAAHATAHEY